VYTKLQNIGAVIIETLLIQKYFLLVSLLGERFNLLIGQKQMTL